MGFDRSKFAASKMSAVKKQDGAVAKSFDKKKSGTDFLRFAEGKNRVRVYPAHPGTDSFTHPKTVSFLECEVTYKKDGKEVTEMKKMPVFNARIHSGGVIKVDPTELYTKLAFRNAAAEYSDDKERKARLNPITDFKTGITAKTKWSVYADLDNPDGKSFGILDLPTSVRDKANELAIDEDEADDVIVTDPYTDPDQGRILIVTYDRQLDKAKKDPGKYYQCAIDYKKPTPLTDDQLDAFSKLDSLDLILNGAYTRRDFNRTIEALKAFDEKYEFEIFAEDEFLDTLDQISLLLPEDEMTRIDGRSRKPLDGAAPKSTKEAVVAKSEAKAKEIGDTDLPFDMALEDMNKEELEGYIRRNKLDIKVRARHTEEDLVEEIKEEEAEIAAGPVQIEEEEAPMARRKSKSSRLSELED